MKEIERSGTIDVSKINDAFKFPRRIAEELYR